MDMVSKAKYSTSALSMYSLPKGNIVIFYSSTLLEYRENEGLLFNKSGQERKEHARLIVGTIDMLAHAG